MMKYFFPMLAFLFAAMFATAQKGDLMAKSSDKGLYLEHKVIPKESFFALGRLYNLHPKTIAAYNKIDISKGLVIGQVLRVPLNDTNFTQKGNKGTPVYYKLGENEGLMKVSGLHHNVTLENLRNWNGLPDNAVTAGTKLVVGFLVSKEMPSVTLTANPQPKKEVVKEPETPKQETAKVPEETKTNRIPEETQPVKNEVKETPKNADVVQVKNTIPEKQTTSGSSDNGYFKYYFDQQIRQSPVKKDETLTSGIFKTTSGWLDAKYYLLIDGVQPGTIICITNPANNKVIYAKVLGAMIGIRQNEGLNIRLSSAGAAALQVSEEDKFIVKVNY